MDNSINCMTMHISGEPISSTTGHVRRGCTFTGTRVGVGLVTATPGVWCVETMDELTTTCVTPTARTYILTYIVLPSLPTLTHITCHHYLHLPTSHAIITYTYPHHMPSLPTLTDITCHHYLHLPTSHAILCSSVRLCPEFLLSRDFSRETIFVATTFLQGR